MCKKIPYESEFEAQAALNVIGPELADFLMEPYFCTRCGVWHIGHGNPEHKRLAKRLYVLIRQIDRLKFATKQKTREERQKLLDERNAIIEKMRSFNQKS